MSYLKLYNPDAEYSGGNSEPRILKFETSVHQIRSPFQFDVLSRASVIYKNKNCRHCGAPAVTPVESEDIMLSRGGLPIPGSGTLVGFRCDSCSKQWPA
ncbi:hypothetical protein CA54_49080 [Symmachiella macrocystis]|uniref:Uncharacterized protein n=1 Tax=Symmachiella macrocystis TaxID=2527985 RepID=A0A5C6BEF1_9PLAN|nr:hypothetical protein [Symmachiella macrocystis]TWU09666.1 hypothetical protein CA54_49080 [Symmachiella macrocystis]